MKESTRRLLPSHRVQLIIVAVVALVVGAAAGSAGTPRHEGELNKARADLAAAQSDLTTARAQLAGSQASLQQARTDASTAEARAKQDAQQEVAAQKAQLDARSAALDDREAKISAAEQAYADGTIPGNGVFLVGSDIQPGTYRTAGSPGCYYARLRSTDTTDIIDNNITSGPAAVTIRSSDKAFDTQHCAEWHKVS